MILTSHVNVSVRLFLDFLLVFPNSYCFLFFVPLFGFCVVAGCHETRAAFVVACRLGR